MSSLPSSDPMPTQPACRRDAPDDPPAGAPHRWNRRKLILIGVAIAILVAAFWLLPSKQWMLAALDWVRGLGFVYGIIVFVGVYAILSAVGLPTSVLNVGAGVLFGLLYGFLASMAGVMAASIGCFLIARYIARDWVLRRVECRPKAAALLHGLHGDETWKMLVLTRLNPVLPAAVASYCFGVTPVRFLPYAAASFLGNVPLCLVLTYAGWAGRRATGGLTVTQYIVYGLGLLSTIGLTVWITRYTKRKLKELEEKQAADAES